MGSKTSSHSSASQSFHGRHRRHHKSAAKFLLFLHTFNLLFALVSIGLFIAIIPVWNANFFHTSGILRGDWPDGLLILPLSITFFTSAFYFLKLGLSRWSATKSGDYLKSRHSSRHKSTSSKSPIFLTLTTLALLLAFLILSATSGLYRIWRPAVITSSVELSTGTPSTSITLSTLSARYIVHSLSDTTPTSPGLTLPKSNPSAHNAKATFSSCTLANVFTRRCNPTLYLLGDLQITAISTASLVWLLNLIILVLQLRDRQYEKRKLQRSLRAKARSKLDVIEDEMSRAEKGDSSSQKKIHHEKRRGHKKSPSAPSLPSSEMQHVTRPVRAHTLDKVEESPVRPKQHYYDPNITPSRSINPRDPVNDPITMLNKFKPLPIKTTSKPAGPANGPILQTQGQTTYSRAVDEARRNIKPAETMGAWLAGRS